MISIPKEIEGIPLKQSPLQKLTESQRYSIIFKTLEETLDTYG